MRRALLLGRVNRLFFCVAGSDARDEGSELSFEGGDLAFLAEDDVAQFLVGLLDEGEARFESLDCIVGSHCSDTSGYPASRHAFIPPSRAIAR